MDKDKKLIKYFWQEFDAYTLGQYTTFKQNYGKYIEPSIIRAVKRIKKMNYKNVHKCTNCGKITYEGDRNHYIWYATSGVHCYIGNDYYV